MADTKPGLVDRFGRPIRREVLTAPIARANLIGVRQAVGEGASRGLTPVKLAHILREALDNDPERYCELAEEMEEKDLHYLSVLGTRKRQVAQLELSIEAATKDKVDANIAAAVQEALIDSGVLDAYLFDMCDAVGKGFSLGELMWQFTSSRWTIAAIERVDQRFVRFDRATMQTPMLLSDGGQHMPLEPFKFVFLKLSAKSGLPIRGGLARAVAWSYLFKNFAIKDWVQFCEVFGLPLRIGKYPQGATENDKKELMLAIASIASDAAGIIPENMRIEFQETAQKSASADLYKGLCEYLDRQVSKAVLGQTGTTDATGASGLGSGTEHTEVREDIERADAKEISTAINRQIVKPFVDLNFGPQARYPWIRLGRADTQDVAGMVDAAQKLVPLGLKVRAADIRGGVGFTEPAAGDELLTPPATTGAPAFPMPGPAPASGTEPSGGKALDPAVAEISLNGIQVQAILDVIRQLIAREIPESVGAALIAAVGIPEERAQKMAKDALSQPKPVVPPAAALASAIASAASKEDAIARAAELAAGQWEKMMEGPKAEIDKILAEATSLEDAKAKLAKAFPSLDVSGMADALAGLTFQAAHAGYEGEEV